MTKVVDGDRLVAAIVHDSALRDQRAFVDAATSYAVMTFDHHHLAAEASSLLRDVHDSRARIQTAADDERRRIERDLHDGAQQRLSALRIRLELAAELASEGPRGGAQKRPRCVASATTSTRPFGRSSRWRVASTRRH